MRWCKSFPARSLQKKKKKKKKKFRTVYFGESAKKNRQISVILFRYWRIRV